MQQFQNRHWGLNPDLDPEFDELTKPSSNSPASTTMHINPKHGQVDMTSLVTDVTLNWSSDNQVFHSDLNGRAASVVPTTSKTSGSSGELVTKFFWSEESRMGEPDVRNHVPAMEFSWHVFSVSSTAIIHERLDSPQGGARVHHVITFQELMPITKLVGDQFLRCWWDTVTSHFALWKNGIHHRDISVANLMYKVEGGRVAGVLVDFDLATRVESVAGNERTGTIPFMALHLSRNRGLASEIKHLYAYDAESFIWVLVWICLSYDDGELRELGRPLDSWLKMDARRYWIEHVAVFPSWTITAGQGHERNWLVAKECLCALRKQIWSDRSNTPSDVTCERPFQALLAEPHSSHAAEEH